MNQQVIITEEGRSGTVTYVCSEGRIPGWWEFGGGDAVSLISMGSREAWLTGHPWAIAQRGEILSFVASEVVRQKAPGCRAEIDEAGGLITLYRDPGSTARSTVVGDPKARSPEARRAEAVGFVKRYSTLKYMFGIAVLVITLIAGAVYMLGKMTLTVAAGIGTPLGECVRTNSHIATLIRSTDPHVPEITGRGGHTTTSVSILLTPLDGRETKMILIAAELKPDQMALARILGSDGRILWFEVNGIGGVDLKRMELLKPSEVRDPNLPKPGPPIAPDPHKYLSAGIITAPGKWFGALSAEELRTEYAPGKFVRSVVAQDHRKQMRRLYRGTLEAPVENKYHRIVAMEPVNDAEYFNAAFVRMDEASEPLRLSDPDGLLMVHTSEPGLKGTTIVSRVDLDGQVRWTVDTAIDRFKLTQILPGRESVAFVGTRLPVPGKVSEPLLVIVDNASGKVATHSLWR